MSTDRPAHVLILVNALNLWLAVCGVPTRVTAADVMVTHIQSPDGREAINLTFEVTSTPGAQPGAARPYHTMGAK